MKQTLRNGKICGRGAGFQIQILPVYGTDGSKDFIVSYNDVNYLVSCKYKYAYGCKSCFIRANLLYDAHLEMMLENYCGLLYEESG